MMAYDFDSKQYIVQRANGKWDRYCGSVYKFRNLKCTHYVTEGKRYLDFPEKNYCCYCCDAAHGCGILKPDWAADAVYQGEKVENGKSYNVWDKKGLQSNLYWEEKDSKRMYRIDQQPDDVQTYDTNSYEYSFDNSIFNKPDRCKASFTCPWVSVCTALRSQANQFLQRMME